METVKTKNQKGAISMFVLMAMLFFLVTVVGIYTIGSKRAQTQTESVQLVKEKYYTEGEENTIFEQRVSNSTTNIPIYTKEQLWSMGSGKEVEIEGVIYHFAASATYELKNDIVVNIEADMKMVNEANLTKNGYEIYYYNVENNQYYNLASSEEYDLQKDGYYFKRKEMQSFV